MEDHRARAPFRPRRDAVSEVVGSVILLAITVAAFSVLFVLVQGMPKPTPGVSADLQASIERTGPTSVNIVIVHLGGEDLTQGNAIVLVTVNQTTLTYNVSQGLGGQNTFAVGKEWRASVPLPVSPDTRVVVTVVSTASNRVLYLAQLQAGYQSGSAGFPPIITWAYAQASDGTAHVTSNGIQTFRVHAIVIDTDGNLDATNGVFVNLTVVAAGPTLQVNAIGAGRYNLSHTNDAHFQSPDLVVATSIPAGSYYVTVTAQDNAGGTATYRFPLIIDAMGASGGPTLSVDAASVAPISVNSTQSGVAIMRLNLTSTGGDTSVGQLIVTKSGSLPDSQASLSAWLDVNGDGAFSPSDDLEVTADAGFVAGSANVFAVPIATVQNGTTSTVFLVMGLISATDGTNVTFTLQATSSVRGTGVPGGVAANTTGAFPFSTTDIVVGSKLSLEPVSGVPDRLIAGSKNVRVFEFTVRAAGEPFSLKKFNVTLTGTIPRSSASAYVKINGSMISAAQNFDSSRVARFSVSFQILDTAGWIPLEVYLNISGNSGQTLGVQIAAVTESFAQGQISSKGRSGISSQPFPLDSGTVTLTSAGNLSIDEWNETGLATAVRAGMTGIYLHTFKLRAHGENIDFNKLEFVQTGNLTDAQYTAITVRVRAGVWLSGTFFAGKVTWDAGVTGKLFAITINVTNTGEAVLDVYANITTGQQAKQFSLYLNDNTRARGYGKTSLSTLYADPERAPYQLSLGVRRIQGDLLIFGTNLAPSTVLATANLMPWLKLTLKPVGENLTFDEVFLRSLQGVPPAGVVVHLYRDTNNDTTTVLQGDDVDIGSADAGVFGSDALKAFAPAYGVNIGGDTNILFVFDFAPSAAGFQMESRVNTSNTTFRGIYSGATITPNTQVGITNPTQLIYQTPPVTVYDRGTLSLATINQNGDHVNYNVLAKMIRITFSAAVEGVGITALKVHMLGNVTGSVINVAAWWDVNKDDDVTGADTQLGLSTFGSGDVTFSGSPLLNIAAGGNERIIIRILVTSSAYAYKTVGVELTSVSFLTASGATSGLGITPSGTFPITSPAVPIWP